MSALVCVQLSRLHFPSFLALRSWPCHDRDGPDTLTWGEARAGPEAGSRSETRVTPEEAPMGVGSAPGEVTEGIVTILFTDVEGSTALYSAKGDAEAQAVLAAVDELARQQVMAHGGRPIKSLGDGLMAVFPSPRRAVACALAIQVAVARHGERHTEQRVRVRAGLHTGEVSEVDGDLAGEAVAAAARICAKAGGGEVIGSEVVRQLCGSLSGTAFEARGRVALKGFPERWRLYRIVPADAGRTTPLAPGEPTPFVGREAERAELRRLMDRAAAGEGGLVMIGGEPGVGKTRLSQELVAEARGRFRVFVGHCYESGRDLPYMPWVEMLETAMRESPQELREALGDEAPEVARLVPQLRRLFPDIPPPLEVPVDHQRRYTFNSIREYVTRVSRVQRRFYVLEDLHWADESTLLLLEHVAEWLPSIPCLIVGTYRDPPIDVSPQLGDALSRLVGSRQARLLSLQRHSQSEVEVMLRALSGQTPPVAVTGAIYAETEGNAFFVEEVFRHLAESGRLLDEQGRFRDDLRIEELDVPANVRLVTGKRLDRLSRMTQRMLALSAVIGRHLSLELLGAVDELDRETLVEAIEEAERARLVFTEALGVDTHLWFSHEIVRQTLLARLSALRRQGHHLRVAGALERIHASDVELHAADIAHHLLQAGTAAEPSRTAHFLTLAGDRAQGAAAFEEALNHYRTALSILPPQEERRHADLLLKVVFAQRSLGRVDDMVASWEQALPALQTLGDMEAVAQLCFDLSYQLSWVYRLPEALLVARRGLEVVGDHSGPARGRLLAVTALGLSLSNRFEEAVPCIRESKRLADLYPGDSALLAHTSTLEVVYGYATMQFGLGVEAGREAATKLRHAGSLWDLIVPLISLDVHAVGRGLFQESDELEREADLLARRSGHAAATCLLTRNEFPKVAARSADLGVLEMRSQSLCETARTLGRGWRAYAETLSGIVTLWRGQWDAALAHMDEGARLSVPGLWFGIQHGFLALLLAFRRQRDEVFAILDRMAETLPEPARPNAIGQWNLAVLAAEAVSLLGDQERAAALYPLVREALGSGAVIRQYDGALIERVAGMAAADAEMAERHFEAALRQAAELPHLMEHSQVRHFYGRFLIVRGGAGDQDRARVLLEEAVSGYHAIGMPRHEGVAKELLHRVEAEHLRE